MSIFADVT